MGTLADFRVGDLVYKYLSEEEEGMFGIITDKAPDGKTGTMFSWEYVWGWYSIGEGTNLISVDNDVMRELYWHRLTASQSSLSKDFPKVGEYLLARSQK